MTQNVSGQNYAINNTYTVATGTASTLPLVFSTVNPTPQLVNYKVGQLLVNTTTDEIWVLEGFITTAGVVTASWSKVGSGDLTIETLTGNSGGPVGSSGPPNYNVNVPGDNTQGINTVGTPGTNTLQITAFDATTTQKGVSRLATDAEAIAGSITTNVVINPSSLKAKLGAQTLNGIAFGDGQTNPVQWTTASNDSVLITGDTGTPSLTPLNADGKLLIGSSVGPPLQNNLTSIDGTVTITNGHNTIDLSAAAGTNFLLQQVRAQDNVLFVSATGAPTMPGISGVLPTTADGTAYAALTLTITPMSATSVLVIEASINLRAGGTFGGSTITGINNQYAIFKTGSANAILASQGSTSGTAGEPTYSRFSYAPGAMTPITFTMRVGPVASASYTNKFYYLNGVNSTPTAAPTFVQAAGGASYSMLTVTEYAS